MVLTHVPTGLVVKCHDNRLQKVNRMIARQKLNLLLDSFLNAENSKQAMRIEKEQRSKERQKKKQAKAAKRRASQIREDSDSGVE